MVWRLLLRQNKIVASKKKKKISLYFIFGMCWHHYGTFLFWHVLLVLRYFFVYVCVFGSTKVLFHWYQYTDLLSLSDFIMAYFILNKLVVLNCILLQVCNKMLHTFDGELLKCSTCSSGVLKMLPSQNISLPPPWL